MSELTQTIRSFFTDLWRGWETFFFAPRDLLSAGVFRFLFAANAFTMYAIRFYNWKFYFTDEGFLPAEGALRVLPDVFRPDIVWAPGTPAAAFAMNIGLLVALVFLMAGVLPRLSALIGFILHIALVQRNFAISYGADFINTFMFFALIFIRSGDRFSIAAKLRGAQRPRLDEGSLSQLLSSAGVRVMQIQLCIIYLYTGLEKMRGDAWWDGTAIWGVIGNQQLAFVNSMWVRDWPMILGAMTFITLLFEIYFAPLVWAKPTRKWILLIGSGLHLGIAFSVGLFFFSFGMMCNYVLWAEPLWLERVLRRLRVPASFIGVRAS